MTLFPPEGFQRNTWLERLTTAFSQSLQGSDALDPTQIIYRYKMTSAFIIGARWCSGELSLEMKHFFCYNMLDWRAACTWTRSRSVRDYLIRLFAPYWGHDHAFKMFTATYDAMKECLEDLDANDMFSWVDNIKNAAIALGGRNDVLCDPVVNIVHKMTRVFQEVQFDPLFQVLCNGRDMWATYDGIDGDITSNPLIAVCSKCSVEVVGKATQNIKWTRSEVVEALDYLQRVYDEVDEEAFDNDTATRMYDYTSEIQHLRAIHCFTDSGDVKLAIHDMENAEAKVCMLNKLFQKSVSNVLNLYKMDQNFLQRFIDSKVDLEKGRVTFTSLASLL
jgi:hypothetical protein